jgi:chlorobactene glucosyltransferase
MTELVMRLAVLQWAVLALAVYVLMVCLSNLLAMPRLGSYPSRPHYPRVSILVPARNEEENLPRLIPSLLTQDYPDFEVVVLDDNSSDRTPEVLAEYASRDSRLRILSGRPTPSDWLGKNWACHQLFESTTSEWVLFTDADTVHGPGALRAAMDAALHLDLGFLSAIINQEIRTWGERLVVPFFSIHHVFCVVPFELGYRLRRLRVFAANGQFMLFRRQAYDRIGGYSAVRSAVLDDQSLVARVVAHGLRWRICDAHRFVSCRMYRSWSGVFEGFTKSVFTAFAGAIEPFCLAWTAISLLFFGPLAIMALAAFRAPLAPVQLPLAIATILVTLVFWLASSRRFGVPLYLAFLYPATAGIALAIALRSVVMLSAGRATWKGRIIAQPATSNGPLRVSRPTPVLRQLTYAYWYVNIGVTLLFYAYYRLRR